MNYIRLAFAAAILIVILGLATTAFWYRGNAIAARADAAQARADLQTAVAVNKANEAAVARLKADKEASDKLAADLAEEVDAANSTTLNIAKALADLRAKDVEIDHFLKLPVPPALRSMYDPAAKGHH